MTQRASNGARVVAGVFGTIALGVAARYTYGAVLLAPLGMAVVWLFVRRRQGALSRPASWFAAVCAVEIVLLAGAAFAAVNTPEGTLAKIQHAADSVDANPPPPPAWLERISPGSTERARASRIPMHGTAVTRWLIVGAIMGTGMIAVFVGTVGWLASLALAFAITGGWIGSPQRSPPQVEEPTTV
jgi:hypothetical protein